MPTIRALSDRRRHVGFALRRDQGGTGRVHMKFIPNSGTRAKIHTWRGDFIFSIEEWNALRDVFGTLPKWEELLNLNDVSPVYDGQE